MNSVKNVLSYYGFMCIVGFDVILEVVRHVGLPKRSPSNTQKQGRVLSKCWCMVFILFVKIILIACFGAGCT